MCYMQVKASTQNDAFFTFTCQLKMAVAGKNDDSDCDFISPNYSKVAVELD